MHKTTTALLAAGVFLAVLLTVTGATWLGNGRHFGPAPQPRVEQAQAHSPAHDWRTPVPDPASHTGRDYVCPTGMTPYDTEDPAQGVEGIVCAWMEV